MTEKEEEKTEELCYYRLNLMSLLKSSYPEYLDDEDFISSRAQEAARVFEDAVRNGSNYLDASAEANRTLYRGLGFSKFDTVFTVDCTLDIYGKVRTFEGSSLNDCPFRYQGMYADSELDGVVLP